MKKFLFRSASIFMAIMIFIGSFGLLAAGIVYGSNINGVFFFLILVIPFWISFCIGSVERLVDLELS